MNKFLLVVFSLMIIIGITACDKNKEEAPAAKKVEGIAGVTTADLAYAECSGCGMSLEKHAITDTVHYESGVYGFCNSDCKDKFVKDPIAAIEKLKAGNEEMPPPPPAE